MQRIVKVGDNNVEVQQYVVDENQREIITDTKSFGSDRVQSQEESLLKRLDFWENADMEKYRADQIASVREQLDLLNQVKSKLEESK
jgi:hypothetical protein